METQKAPINYYQCCQPEYPLCQTPYPTLSNHPDVYYLPQYYACQTFPLMIPTYNENNNIQNGIDCGNYTRTDTNWKEPPIDINCDRNDSQIYWTSPPAHSQPYMIPRPYIYPILPPGSFLPNIGLQMLPPLYPVTLAKNAPAWIPSQHLVTPVPPPADRNASISDELKKPTGKDIMLTLEVVLQLRKKEPTPTSFAR